MRITGEQIEIFRKQASDWLATKGFTCEDVKLGTEAWIVAHYAGITETCYAAGFVDAHIKTALAKIMPNAVFKDVYHY